MSTFTVPAGDQSVLIGEVKAGETWRFTASGKWKDWYRLCGPEGYKSFLFHVLDVWPRYRGAPYFALVGMLEGQPGTEFVIGPHIEHDFVDEHGAKLSGTLIVFANDHLKAYGNNSGAITLDAAPIPGPALGAGPLRGWSLWRQVLDRLQGVGFVAFLAIGVCLSLAMTPQGRDLVRTVGEDRFLGWHQILFAVMLFFLGMQAWFWPRVIINFHYGADRKKWRPGRFLQVLPRALGVAPFVLTFVAMIRNPASSTIGSVAVLGLGLIFFLFVLVRQDIPEYWRKLTAVFARVFRVSARNQPRRRESRPGRMWVLVGLGLAAVTMVLFSIDPVTVPRWLGPPAVVFLGVSLIIPPLVLVIQSGASVRFPALPALLVAALMFSFWLDNHQVGRRATQTLLQASTKRPTLDQAYDSWRSQFTTGEAGAAAPPLSMVLVAAEGGASRAGFWTGEVLAALERESGGEFGRRLFAINSISGGSVGAVGYAAALSEWPDSQPLREARDFEALETRVQRFAGADALSPVVTGLLFSDLLQRFVPVNLPTPDRAEALERSWEVAWAADCPAGRACNPERIRAPYLDIWRNPHRRWTPAVIVNGASEETGRRILTSPIMLPPAVIGRSSDGLIDADDFYDVTGTDVPASTAIHNGARFPYVSPAGTLRSASGRYQHIVDGGYFDGAGIEATRQLAIALAKLATTRRDTLTITIVFIGYDAKPKPSGRIAGNETLAPLVGMVGSRAAHQSHMWRQLYGTTQSDPNAAKGSTDLEGPMRLQKILLRDEEACEGDKPNVFQEPFTQPMDWALSERAKTMMRWYLGFGNLTWKPRGDCKNVVPAVQRVVRSMRSPEAAPGPVYDAPANVSPAALSGSAAAKPAETQVGAP